MTNAPQLPTHDPLTVADIDEWLADIRSDAPNTTHTPNEWTRTALAALLGEEIPYRLWASDELTALLERARKVA